MSGGCSECPSPAAWCRACRAESERDNLAAAVAELKRENDQLVDWKKNILGTVQSFPEYKSGAWAGDKEGWGFCFELINYVRRQRDEAFAKVDALKRELEVALAVAAATEVSS